MSDTADGGSTTTLPEVTVTAPRYKPETQQPTPPAPPQPQPAPAVPDGLDNRLWMRAWSLVVANQDTQVDLSDLHIIFTVSWNLNQTTKSLECRVFNLGRALSAKVSKEYTRVTLNAGYRKPSRQYGLIFDGQVAYYEYGKDSTTDTFLAIYANGNDQAINQATLNTTLPAGSTQDDVVKACTDSMAGYGVTRGYISPLPQQQSPRARTLFGMTRDILRDVAQSNGMTCHVADGKVNLVKQGEYVPGNPIKLNSKTGMVSIPRQTMGAGIDVVSLLNPAIKPGTKITLNEADLVRVEIKNPLNPKSPAGGIQGQGTAPVTSDTGADGDYKVVSVRHNGDNRSTPWFTEIQTEALLPQQQAPALPKF